MKKDSIRLDLSVDEINTILKALGNLPFNQVFELVGKIHETANQQLFELENPINSDKLKKSE